jgi:diguanylate cyclase (GGDEF)-like protein
MLLFSVILLAIAGICLVFLVLHIRKNNFQLGFHKLISESTLDFSNISKADFKEKTEVLLYKTGQFLSSYRSWLITFSEEGDAFKQIYEWSCHGDRLGLDFFKDVRLYNSSSKFFAMLKNNEIVYITNPSSFPFETPGLNDRLRHKYVKAIIAVPVISNGTVIGFLAYVFRKHHKKWPEENVKLMRIIANLIADASIKIKAAEDIEYLAYYDHMTGIPNRTLFLERASQSIKFAKRYGRHIGVLFIDLDGFKTVNDILGHNTGDIVINEVADALAERLRKTDMVARIGGDEFLILVNDIHNTEDMNYIANDIIGLFKQSFAINGQVFLITASIGASVYPFDGEDADALIKNADIAMYKAKALGKNRYVQCTGAMKEEVQTNLSISNSLYGALEREELYLKYQPQVDMNNGEIIGVEALLNWKHPKAGLIPPSLFLPLAEKNGMINSMAEWVIRTACSQNRAWQEMGLAKIRMAVNLPVSQLINPGLVDIIENILQETGLDADCLELEISESIVINETKNIIHVMESLKKLGVTITIDNFGMNYSSLSRLKQLPVDRIKIDKHFIGGLDQDEKDRAITEVIISLAKGLDLKVVAEGVETLPQMEFLKCKNCDEGQGCYYHSPMSCEDIIKVLGSPAVI